MPSPNHKEIERRIKKRERARKYKQKVLEARRLADAIELEEMARCIHQHFDTVTLIFNSIQNNSG